MRPSKDRIYNVFSNNNPHRLQRGSRTPKQRAAATRVSMLSSVLHWQWFILGTTRGGSGDPFTLEQADVADELTFSISSFMPQYLSCEIMNLLFAANLASFVG